MTTIFSRNRATTTGQRAGLAFGLLVLGWGAIALAVEDNEAAARKADKPIDAMLATLDIRRDDLKPDPVAVLGPRSIHAGASITLRLLLHPLDGPYIASHTAAQQRYWADSPLRLLLLGVSRTPAEVSRGYFGNPLRDGDKRLRAAADPLEAGFEALRETARKAGRVSPLPDPDTLPALSAPWRREIGRLLFACASAIAWRDKAFARLDDNARAMFKRPTSDWVEGALGRADADVDLRLVLRDFDYEYLLAGGLDLAAALEDFQDFLRSKPEKPGADLKIATPYGWVVLRSGNGGDFHGIAPRGHHLLLIDLGGDDTYTTGVLGDGLDWPAQIIVDAKGDDKYMAPQGRAAAWGGAIAGYSFLLDAEGDDRYIASQATQGAAIFGVGMLIDGAGNDRYYAIHFAQGAGYAGVGILQDRKGRDSYDAITHAQGLGKNLGSGTLFDEAGDDAYQLDDANIVFPSAQAAKHNDSMGQGMGVGQRADLFDGHSVAGGVGLLYDRAGDDRYSAGVFAQGSGFLGGTGILIDDSGADSYKAVYYVQGASAHRAVGILVDGAGDDAYEAERQCAQGCGHDFGVGWLLDRGGNDRHKAYRLAMGAANENGWGFLVDLAGDDAYEITANPAGADSLGAAKESLWGSMREDMPALGLFLDAGGKDAYTGVPGAADGGRWLYSRTHPDLELKSERGIGWDGDFADVDLRVEPLTPPGDRDRKDYEDTVKQRRAYRR